MSLSIFATIMTIALLDSIWIYLNRDRYNQLSLDVSGHPSMSGSYGIPGAIISYILIVSVIVIVGKQCVKCSELPTWKASLLYGGLLGAFAYGVFNGTNLVLFKNYNVLTAIIDTLWGIFLLSISLYIYVKSSK